MVIFDVCIGLKRCGKSCRLCWLNYLRPDIKRGNITPDEEELIIRLHRLLGNRWSLIAGRLPGRTDNEIKNYWNTKLGKRVNQDSEVNTATTTSKKSRKNKKSKRELSNDKTVKPMSTLPSEFNVVRTKPIRCTRSFINEPQHGLEGANNIMTNNFKEYSSSCFSSSTLDIASEFMGNMENYRMISELVTSKFLGACDFSYGSSGGDNDLSPSSVEHPFVLSQELLEDWLGEQPANLF